jgi:hypothetical protein
VSTGSPVRTIGSVARLIILATFAIIVGQAVAMASIGLLPVHTTLLGDQRPSLTRAPLQQDRPGVPCDHHGSGPGHTCCCASACPMLTLALPVPSLVSPPAVLRLLVYRDDARVTPAGVGGAPLVPPPRRRV